MPPAPKHDPHAALRVPDFRRYIAARALFSIRHPNSGVVVGWQIFKLTNDPLALGLIGLAEAIPSITVSLYAGHVADSVRRKRIVVPAVVVLVLCAFTLWWLAHPLQQALLRSGRLHVEAVNATIVWPLYLVIFVSGIARGFMGPALFSFMPQLLPERGLLPNAVTWSSTTWQASAVVGPAIGGLLLHRSIEFAYGVDLVLKVWRCSFSSVLPAASYRRIEGERLSLARSILSGVKFIFGNQLVLAALSLDMFAVLFGGAVALLPFFAGNILHGGPDAFGYLRAASPWAQY
ncbi:MAG: MFS transporter [Hymenobacter sp.]